MEKRINFKPCNLPNQRIKTVDHAFVLLGDKYFKYSIKMVTDDYDEDEKSDLPGQWTLDMRNDYELIMKKEDITGIEFSVTAIKTWEFVIFFNGKSPIHITFSKKDEEAGRDMLTAFYKYLFN